jgi:adenosylcobinamide-phosphate synthase
MSLGLLSLGAVALDALFGEPRGWHPLVAFGKLANRLEQRFNPGGCGWRSHGVSAWILAVLPLTFGAWLLSELPYVGALVGVVALYAAIGLRSLNEHAEPVANALQAGDLPEARKRVGYMVSRETRELDEPAVARAGVCRVVLVRGRRCAGRGALSAFQHPGRHVGLPQRALRALRLGRGAHR